MGRFKKLDKEKIIELYQGGMEAKEVAEELGCSPVSVNKVVMAAGIRRPEIDRGKIHALAKAGWPIPEIAAEMRLEEGLIKECLGGARNG